LWEGAVDAAVLWEAPWAGLLAEDLLAMEARVFLDEVGVTGEKASLMGEVGESRSLESFVRFFFRNPRVGIRAAVKECCHALAGLPGELHGAAGTYGELCGMLGGAPTTWTATDERREQWARKRRARVA